MKLKIIKTTTILSTLLCTALLCGCGLGSFKVGGYKMYTGAVITGLGILDPDASWKKKKKVKEKEIPEMNQEEVAKGDFLKDITALLNWKPFADPKEVEVKEKEIRDMNEEEAKQELKVITQLAKDGKNPWIIEDTEIREVAVSRQRKLLDRLKELK
jgi:hypothetical protein